jgi:hypothetical protein
MLSHFVEWERDIPILFTRVFRIDRTQGPWSLDVDRYEHLREVWFSHGVRQKVLTERAMARQVIPPDFLLKLGNESTTRIVHYLYIYIYVAVHVFLRFLAFSTERVKRRSRLGS